MKWTEIKRQVYDIGKKLKKSKELRPESILKVENTRLDSEKSVIKTISKTVNECNEIMRAM